MTTRAPASPPRGHGKSVRHEAAAPANHGPPTGFGLLWRVWVILGFALAALGAVLWLVSRRAQRAERRLRRTN